MTLPHLAVPIRGGVRSAPIAHARTVEMPPAGKKRRRRQTKQQVFSLIFGPSQPHRCVVGGNWLQTEELYVGLDDWMALFHPDRAAGKQHSIQVEHFSPFALRP